MNAAPRDLRSYARTTTARLIMGGLAILVVVGGGLVYAIYGGSALVSALLCIGLGLAPVVLVAAAMAGIGILRHWADRG